MDINLVFVLMAMMSGVQLADKQADTIQQPDDSPISIVRTKKA